MLLIFKNNTGGVTSLFSGITESASASDTCGMAITILRANPESVSAADGLSVIALKSQTDPGSAGDTPSSSNMPTALDPVDIGWGASPIATSPYAGSTGGGTWLVYEALNA